MGVVILRVHLPKLSAITDRGQGSTLDHNQHIDTM